MLGQIFISYRRDDASHPAGRLYDRFSSHFGESYVFMDVDNLNPGVDFIEAIEKSVDSCDVLIAVIGNRWLISSDEGRRHRLDNPEDFVRIEIATALKRGIRVIPVLVDGASMPRSGELPDDLELLVRRNALEVSHTRFRADSERLIRAVELALEETAAERREALLDDQTGRTFVREPYGPQISDLRLFQLLELAKTDARAAIKESWDELGGTVLRAANVSSGNNTPDSVDISLSLKRLEADVRFPHELIRSITDLQQTARKVFNLSKWAYDPSVNEAQNYVHCLAEASNELAQHFP
jgi:hypothetical protein